MTKLEYEIMFRENPGEIIKALHALKVVAGEFSEKSPTSKDKVKWDSILFHAIQTHGVTMLMS